VPAWYPFIVIELSPVEILFKNKLPVTSTLWRA
jgi:hypothetical protein